MSKHVYVFGRDTYWLKAIEKVHLEDVRIETVQCQECLSDCLDDLPDPDPGALVLIDIFSHRETIDDVLRTLRGRGWRNIVVIAADPTVKESRSVFRKSLGLDYWNKTYDVAIIQSKIQKCLHEMSNTDSRASAGKQQLSSHLGAHSVTKAHILLADNDGDYRESLRRVLEAENFDVTVVSSVEGAIEKLETRDWAVVLVDWRLSDDNDDRDQSGLQVLHKAVGRRIACITVSAFDDQEAVRLAFRSRMQPLAAVDFVFKSEGPQAVLNAIHQFFGITLLHISDLHPRVTASGEVPYDQEQAYTKFLQDMLAQPGLGLNPLCTVIVSGDISYRNQDDSFDRARHYLMDLSTQLGIALDRFVITPGNHDINRWNAQHTQDSLQAMRATDLLWFSKYDKYLEFTRHFYGEPAFSPDKMYRLFTFENQVAVVAFNSCLVEGDDHWKCQVCAHTTGKEHYLGWIDRRQIIQAGEELDAMNGPALRIGVFHHHVVSEEYNPPPDACQGDHLWPYHQTEYRLNFTFFEQGFQILLHGHRHKIELKQPQTLGMSAPFNLGSGAFWSVNDDEHETANYLLLQLSPISGKSRVIMRKYFPASVDRPGYWGADNSVHPEGMIPLPGLIVPAVRTG